MSKTPRRSPDLDKLQVSPTQLARNNARRLGWSYESGVFRMKWSKRTLTEAKRSWVCSPRLRMVLVSLQSSTSKKSCFTSSGTFFMFTHRLMRVRVLVASNASVHLDSRENNSSSEMHSRLEPKISSRSSSLTKGLVFSVAFASTKIFSWWLSVWTLFFTFQLVWKTMFELHVISIHLKQSVNWAQHRSYRYWFYPTTTTVYFRSYSCPCFSDECLSIETHRHSERWPKQL